MSDGNAHNVLVDVQLEHEGFSVAWSPDGTRLLVGQDQGQVELWTSEGHLIRSIRPHQGRVASAVWYREGSRVVTASWDNTLRVWDSRLETERFFVESEDDFNAVAVSSDEMYFAAASDDKNVWIIDSRNGQVLHRSSASDDPYVNAADWSPRGLHVATASDGGVLRIWDAPSGEELLAFEEQSSEMMSLSWSPDGERIASLERGGGLVVWEATSGRILWRQETDRGDQGLYRHSVCWSPEGGIVASVSDGPVRFFDGRSGECVRVSSTEGYAGAFSPEGSRFAVVGSSLRILDVTELTISEARTATRQGSESWFVRQAQTVGRGAERSRPKGKRLSSLRSSRSGDSRVVRRLEDVHDAALDLHPTEHALAIGDEAGGIRLVDLESGAEREFDDVHNEAIRAVAWSPDGRLLASASTDATAAVVEARTGDLVGRFRHDEEVYTVAWSPDGHLLASGGDDHTVAVWQRDGSLVRRFADQPLLNHVAWSGDGQRLALAAVDGVLCVDAETGTEVGRYDEPIDWVRCVRWSPSDGRFVLGTDERKVVVCDSSGRAVWSIKADDWVFAVDWSPSGRLLAYLQRDGTLAIARGGGSSEFEVLVQRDPEELEVLVPGGVRWSSDGSYLVAAQSNSIVVVDVEDYGESAFEARSTTTPVPGRLTPDLAALPGTLSALHRLRLPAPLSLVRDLRSLLSGGRIDTPVGSLATLPGMRQLISLRWRGGALAGLVALLLRETQFDDWAPPADLHAVELRRRLTDALRGEVIDPVDPGVSLTPIRQAAEAVDERLMTLLSTLGPEAVAADPGIVLRLLRHVPELPKLAEPQRRLLSLRVAPLEPGPAQGSGIGVDRTGISPSGPLTALLPSQLAYPRDLFIWRYRNRELLYRARTGREPPRLRPAVLVLDVSPASFGPIEGMTRPAAFVLASTLRRSGVPTVLVAAGGQERVHLLEQPADLVRLFTLRSQERADPERVMSVAQGVRGSLRDGALEPVVVLLTQPWWGEGETSRLPGHVRGLFVQYPGRPVRPAWADVCERWETIDSRDHDRLPQALGRLIA